MGRTSRTFFSPVTDIGYLRQTAAPAVPQLDHPFDSLPVTSGSGGNVKIEDGDDSDDITAFSSPSDVTMINDVDGNHYGKGAERRYGDGVRVKVEEEEEEEEFSDCHDLGGWDAYQSHGEVVVLDERNSATSSTRNGERDRTPMVEERERRRERQYSNGDAAAARTADLANCRDDNNTSSKKQIGSHVNDSRTSANRADDSSQADKQSFHVDMDSLMELTGAKASKHAKFPPGCPVVCSYRPLTHNDDGNHRDRDDVSIQFGNVLRVYVDLSSSSNKRLYQIATPGNEDERISWLDLDSIAFAPQCPIVYRPEENGPRKGAVLLCRRKEDGRTRGFVYTVLLQLPGKKTGHVIKYDVDQGDISYRPEEGDAGSDCGAEKCEKAEMGGKEKTVPTEDGKDGEGRTETVCAEADRIRVSTADDRGKEGNVENIDNGNTVLVHSLHRKDTEENIRSRFSRFGAIVDLKICKRRKSGSIEFQSPESASAVMDAKTILLNGHRIRVERPRGFGQTRNPHTCTNARASEPDVTMKQNGATVILNESRKKKIFVKSLRRSDSVKSIKEYFSKFGTIFRFTRFGKGNLARIEFKSHKSGIAAVEEREHILNDHVIRVEYDNPTSNKSTEGKEGSDNGQCLSEMSELENRGEETKATKKVTTKAPESANHTYRHDDGSGDDSESESSSSESSSSSDDDDDDDEIGSLMSTDRKSEQKRGAVRKADDENIDARADKSKDASKSEKKIAHDIKDENIPYVRLKGIRKSETVEAVKREFSRFGHIVSAELCNGQAIIEFQSPQSSIELLRQHKISKINFKGKDLIISYSRKHPFSKKTDVTKARVVVSNLPPNVDEETLRDTLRCFGQIESVRLKSSERSGIVQFRNAASASRSVTEPRKNVAGFMIKIAYAPPSHPAGLGNGLVNSKGSIPKDLVNSKKRKNDVANNTGSAKKPKKKKKKK